MNWKFWERVDTSGSNLGLAGRLAAGLFVLYLLLCSLIAWWWDDEPDLFSVRESAALHAETHNRRLVTGYITTATLIRLGNTLLEKRGGFLSNDAFPPGVWMDNVPNWEFGVLTQIRDAARAFRIDFSRSQSQSKEDEDLAEAEGKFFFDNSSWAFPPSESEYREGIRGLDAYLARLANPAETGAQFYTRADNLQKWLRGVETRLGSLSQRLSASVGKRQLNLDLAADPGARRDTDAPEEEETKTPWLELDEVFYEARGHTWALIHLLRANGLGPNDAFAVLMENNPWYLQLVWGSQRAGTMLVPVSTRLTAPEIAYILKASEAKLLISTTKFADILAALPGEGVKLPTLVCGSGGTDDFEPALMAQPSDPIADQAPGLIMLYSSGTTGRPKGVRPAPPADPDVLATNPLLGLAVMGAGMPTDGSMVYLSPAPLYHAAPIGWCSTAQRLGGTVVVMEKSGPSGTR